MRILLIDDDPLLLRTYARLLGLFLEHKVTTAADAASALALIESEEIYDLIFCDLTMQPISGIDLHKSLCGHDSEMAERFILLTGGTDSTAAEAYIHDFQLPLLIKPVKSAAFEEAIKRFTPKPPQ